MKIQINEKDLEWTLSFHKTFPKNIFATKDARTPFIKAGTPVAVPLRMKIREMINRSGLPFLDVSGPDELNEFISQCYKPKEDEATAMLKNARALLGDIFYEDEKFVSRVTYDDLEGLYTRNTEIIDTDSLLREAVVNVMDFEKEKFSHLANVFFLSYLFFRHYNERKSRKFDIDKMWPGILLHDVGKPRHHYRFETAKKQVYQFEYINFDEIQVHPKRGKRILLHDDSVEFPKESVEIVYRHHQRPDGGYPELLEGEIIPLYVHLFSMTDVYEQLMAKKEVESRWTKELVIRKMEVDARKGRIHKMMWMAFKDFLAKHDREAGRAIKRI
ncbi:MAG: HD domain-containing protein [Desulfobacterales bacterium]|nr:HD domain-containing protein [Desulfobacterales bacterium]